jgi:hypothetical protein
MVIERGIGFLSGMKANAIPPVSCTMIIANETDNRPENLVSNPWHTNPEIRLPE